MRSLSVLAVIFSASVNALHPRCLTTSCASPNCPSGTVSHAAINGANGLVDGGSCPNGNRRNLCCYFPKSNAEWAPPVPVDGHHTCLTSDPCPAKGKISLYEDEWGPESRVCYSGKFWYCETAPAPPSAPSNVGTFSHQGCYTDSSSSRGLTDGSFVDNNGMTVDACVARAASAGARYASVEYSKECYWGDNLWASSQKVSNNECDLACAGNKNQACGGAGRMNVYKNSAFTEPIENPAYNGWVSQGCFSDSSTARALPNRVVNFDAMSLSWCSDKAKGYKYAALEYGSECYYGNELASTSTKQSSGCNMACPGWKQELCGGPDRINLYLNTNYAPPPPPASTNPGIGNFKSVGCYVDDPNARTLPDSSKYQDDAMTVAKCISRAGNAKYAGVENGNQCFYGNEMSSTGVLVGDGCVKSCVGKADEICGGSRRLTMYENKAYAPPPPPPDPKENPGIGSFKSRGCFSDGDSRTIPGNSWSDTAMTVEKCINKAGDARYAGVENGNECWYGDDLNGSKTSGCNTACGGKATELCGGGWKINVYENEEWAVSNQEVADKLEELAQIMERIRVSNNDWLADLEAFVIPSRKLRRRQLPDISLARTTALLNEFGTVRSAASRLIQRGLGVTPAQRNQYQEIHEMEEDVASRLRNPRNSNIQTTDAREFAIQQAKYSKTAIGTLGAAATGILGLFALLIASILGRNDDHSTTTTKTTTTSTSTSSTITIITPPVSTTTDDDDGPTKTNTDTDTDIPLPTATYIIYPTVNLPFVQEAAIELALTAFANAQDIFRADHAYAHIGVSYWKVPLNFIQKKALEALPGIMEVAAAATPCTDSCEDPTTESSDSTQKEMDKREFHDADSEHKEMRKFSSKFKRQNGGYMKQTFMDNAGRPPPPLTYNHNSWQMALLSDSNSNYYLYDDSAGAGTTVYVVDTGVNANHIAFQQYGTNRWIHARPTNREQDEQILKHGTCVADLATGHLYGAAKRANRVFVSVPRDRSDYVVWVESLDAVLVDLKARGNGAKSVVALALYFNFALFSDRIKMHYAWRHHMYERLRLIAAEQALLVAGTGNNREAHDMQGFPAGLAKPGGVLGFPHIPSMLTVGAVKGDCLTEYVGTNRDDSGLPHVHAPGVEVRCANGNSNTNFWEKTGTSMATGITAGVAAYIRGHPLFGHTITTAQDLKDYMIYLATQRQAAAPLLHNFKCVWNGHNVANILNPTEMDYGTVPVDLNPPPQP